MRSITDGHFKLTIICNLYLYLVLIWRYLNHFEILQTILDFRVIEKDAVSIYNLRLNYSWLETKAWQKHHFHICYVKMVCSTIFYVMVIKALFSPSHLGFNTLVGHFLTSYYYRH
jgi:hypothetical protein